MHALDGGDVRDAARLQPIEEFHGRARIGAARVRIADIGGEEFKKTIGRALASGGDEGGGAIGEDDELGHSSLLSDFDSCSSRMKPILLGGSFWVGTATRSTFT